MSSGVYKYDTKAGERWRIVYDGPPKLDPTTGKAKRHQVQRRGFTRERDAKRALREALTAVETAQHVEYRRDTLGSYLTSWLDGIDVRPTTAAQYRQQVKLRILPYPVAAKRLQDVTTEDLDALYRTLTREGGHKGKPLAAKSVRHTHGVLRTALGDAKRRGYIVRNPAEDARPPKVRRTELDVWSAEQLRTFLTSVEDDRLYALWLLLATTGMRRGEALGLRWEDVDLDDGALMVRHNRTVVEGQPINQETKSDAGRRRIALDPQTVAALKRHRVRQLEERMRAANAWEDNGVVFVREDGRELHPKQASRWFADHAEAAGLPPIRLHDVRHSYATVALTGGVPITVVSRRLGHATVSITLDVYSHVLPTDDGDAAVKVATAILGGQ